MNPLELRCVSQGAQTARQHYINYSRAVLGKKGGSVHAIRLEIVLQLQVWLRRRIWRSCTKRLDNLELLQHSPARVVAEKCRAVLLLAPRLLDIVLSRELSRSALGALGVLGCIWSTRCGLRKHDLSFGPFIKGECGTRVKLQGQRPLGTGPALVSVFRTADPEFKPFLHPQTRASCF